MSTLIICIIAGYVLLTVIEGIVICRDKWKRK